MTKVTLPRTNQTGANEWSDVESNDNAIIEVVNGNIDNENIKAEAGIIDSKLASPNNASYRTLLSAQGILKTDSAAASYILGTHSEGKVVASAGNVFSAAVDGLAPPLFYFDDADYTVGGKTQKLRLRAQVLCNATKAAIKFTFGLYPITVAGGGGGEAFTMTLGTVVTSSTVEINEPAASTATSAVNSDFTIPSDGTYVIGVVTNATLTNNSAVIMAAQLQTRSV